MKSTLLALSLTLIWWVPILAPATVAPRSSDDSAAWLEQLHRKTPSTRPEAIRAALNAVHCAQGRGMLSNARLLTVIDYSLPSTEPRLWVIDLPSRRVIFEELVAHGKNSGDNLSSRFSNEPGSLQTSLGLFVTGDTYIGRNGYSLRLDGLEPGVNDRARERAVVIHGAPYVSPEASRRLGRLGRSWGCPALRPTIARQLIDAIKGGTPVFAYYPDQRLHTTSRLAVTCATGARSN